MLENLYGKHAAALYAQAADFNKTARFYYMKAEDAYYLANAQASYDDWRRARRQWDYFYRYEFSSCLSFPVFLFLIVYLQPKVSSQDIGIERSFAQLISDGGVSLRVSMDQMLTLTTKECLH
jgi:hypothetical protein